MTATRFFEAFLLYSILHVHNSRVRRALARIVTGAEGAAAPGADSGATGAVTVAGLCVGIDTGAGGCMQAGVGVGSDTEAAKVGAISAVGADAVEGCAEDIKPAVGGPERVFCASARIFARSPGSVGSHMPVALSYSKAELESSGKCICFPRDPSPISRAKKFPFRGGGLLALLLSFLSVISPSSAPRPEDSYVS